MSKKSFKPTPTTKKQPTDKEIDQFLDTGHGHDTQNKKTTNTETQISVNEESAVKPARLTIDLPPRTHRRFKSACALNSTKMKKEVYDFIERRTAELEKAVGV